MQTFDEQKAFFEKNWVAMKAAAEKDGAKGVLAFLDDFAEPLQRRVLSLFARQGLVMKEWAGKSFDTYATVIRGAIDRILEEGRASDDPERATKAKGLANVISYNLAADLADCWPGDDAKRTKADFEAGLRAAEDCVRWRDELQNGPAPMSMALWAKGMHELSLAKVDASVDSFERSLKSAEEASESESDFSVLLGRGYVGLARMVRGDEAGRAEYDAAVQAFRDQLEDEDKKADAQFGIDQLEVVRTRYT